MGDLRVFSIAGNSVKELKSSSFTIEKSLQSLIEQNLEKLLGVRFLETEYSTGRTHGGRIDTLGIDENGYPVIIEYKTATNENVINQGLFYLTWLLDHKAEFELRVLEKKGDKVQKEIDWSSPRLICIAGDYTKYDIHSVQLMNRSIDLIRYRRFENHLIIFELVNATTAQSTDNGNNATVKKSGRAKTVTEYLTQSDQEMTDLYNSIEAFIVAMGDDVQKRVQKNYIAYKRFTNFVCLEVHPQARKIVIFLKLDPTTVTIEDGFSRDVTNIGHFGNGDLEITLKSVQDFERSKNLIVKSYEEN
jgi:predicted transport protein